MVEEHNAREILYIPDSGIPKDRLISCAGEREKILMTLECSICKKIAYYPKYCTVCEKLLCTRCLESQKSKNTNQCPKAECQENKLASMENTQLLSIIVSTLGFKCHNEECKDNLKYSELDKHLCKFDYFSCKAPKCLQKFPRMLIDDHEATCEFILTRCEHIGCEEEVERGKMEEHARICDYRRIICPGCQELKLQKEIAEHENICPKIQLKCPNTECPILIPRGDMEVHLVECDFRPLKCPDCEHEHPQKDIEEHKSRCPKANLPCSGCGYFLHREDFPAHECLRYLADQLRSLVDIQVRKQKITAHLVQKEAEIETANNIIMQNQIVMNQKIDRIEKREADLERANMKYIQNSMDILKKTKELEEKERKLEDVQKELKQGQEELNEKVFSLMEREKVLVKNQWELKEDIDRNIDHKLKILEEKKQLFEKSSIKFMKTMDDKLRKVEDREIQLLKDLVRSEQRAEEINLRISALEEDGKIEQKLKILEEKEINFKSSVMETMEDKLRKVEEREIQRLKETKSNEVRVEQRAEEIYVRIRTLEEHDAIFTEGHKKQDEDKRIQEQKLKEMEKTLEKLEFLIGNQRQILVKRANNEFYGYVSGSEDRSLIFMNNQLNVVHKYRGKNPGYYSRIIQLDNNLIAASNSKGNIEIIDPTSHQLISTLTGHEGGYYILGLYELGNGHLVSASEDKTIRLWNTEEGKCLQIFKGHKDWVHSILEHSSGDLISGSDDKTNRVWNVGTGICSKIIPGFEGHTWWILELADGKILSVCESKLKSLRIWDCKRGEVINDITSCYDYGWTTACIVDEEIIILGGWKLVVEFNVRTLEYERRFSNLHTQWIRQIVMGGEDIYISCSRDQTVQMFNMKSKQILHSMKQHTNYVYSVIGLQIKDQGY